jgi:RNA polymerase sporulation-specific sigma factor
MTSKLADRSSFVEQNLGLVHHCAKRFLGRGIEYDDLYSAGCVGLVKAVDGFDETRGVKFSTYAVPLILGEMRRLFRDGGSIKVSRSLKELSLRATRCRERFLLDHGCEPTVDELAALLEVPRELAIESLCVSAPPLSLTISEDEEHGNEIDVPVEPENEQIENHLALQKALRKLEPRDRELLLLRYFKSKTQVETAKQLDMTQVQVSRREKKLLLFLRSELNQE